MELVIHVELRSATGEAELTNQTFELPGVESGPMNGGERVILDTLTLAQTQVYGQYLATVARESTETAQADFGGNVVENATVYRVDGEIGCVTFPTYALRKDDQIVWNSVPGVFGAQGAPRVLGAAKY